MVKDVGMKLRKTVEKFDVDTASEMVKFCDDLFTAESISNKTDPELKRMAITGLKKVLSGATNDISNTFAYDSTTVKART